MGKPIEEIANDVNYGDLIKLNFNPGFYVGIFWGYDEIDKEFLILKGRSTSSFTKNLWEKDKGVKLNLLTKTLEGEKVESYEILGRRQKYEILDRHES